MRVALGMEYDGTTLHGWQRQPGGGTVQDALEAALAAVAGHAVDVVCAGRTDAGVHALGQVVHFDTAAARPLSAWTRGTNTHLPPQVAVLWARAVPDAFHARYCATARHYEYLLVNRPVRPAIGWGHFGWYHGALDLDGMRAAAAVLVGRHDFSAFRSSECQAKSPVRELRRLEIVREGDIIRISLEANAFLHHMVRNIVGTLVYAGKGAYDAVRVRTILESRSRANAAPTFAPDGLYLAAVEYEPHWDLPACGAALPVAMRRA